MQVNTQLLQELEARGLIYQKTAEKELYEHLLEPRTLYCGFDPTADSLHLGHLVPLLVLRRFQEAGHTPIALVGGATGLIGDPSFKAAERQLNTPELVATWVDKIKAQVSQFIQFEHVKNSAKVVNNLDWTGKLDVLSFLRDVGKHFSVNSMINKESVQQRLHRGGEGISFTEFSYALLQGMDFAELNKSYQCSIQIGGSDQWGNIVGGIDLCRRMNQQQTFGLTVPLITKSDGTKFGKTEGGAVWLDANKTSPYAFYQFWLNTADADAYRFMKYFTFLSLERIEQIEAEDKASGVKPQAQSILAEEVTRLVHGEVGLQAAMRITQALFSGDEDGLSQEDYQQLQQDGLPAAQLPADLTDITLTQLLSDAQVVSSGKQVKDALQRQAIIINGKALGAEDNMRSQEVFAKDNARFSQFFLVKMGKRKHHLFYL